MTRQKFLIIQTAFLGDVVLATGLIEKIRHAVPGAEIDFLVRRGNEMLLAGHPHLNEVLVWDKKNGKLKNLWRMLRTIRRRRYDTVINVQRFAATGLLTAFSKAKETIGFNKNPLSFLFTRKVPHIIGNAQSPVHEIERNTALISHFAGDAVFKPRLYPPAADREAVAAYKKQPYITVSPASVWFTKQWPAEKWTAFLKRVPERYAVYLLGAGSDAAPANEIIQATGKPGITNLCGKISMLQSAALIEGAAMNYANDSAPLHLASAVNAPVTAVYCSTMPWFGFGPVSDITHIVEVRTPLTCRPCGLHGKKACPQGHFKCALDIDVVELLAVLEQ